MATGKRPCSHAVCAFLLVAILALCVERASCQAGKAPAPAPKAMAPMKAPKAPAPPPKLAYAPKRSFSQWVGDLPDDPIFLFGFIVSLLSGVGFLFVIHSLMRELIMGIPYYRVGGLQHSSRPQSAKMAA